MTIYTDSPELTGAIYCILRDISRAVGMTLDDLPSKFDTHKTAAILELSATRTLDTWASRPDRGGLPFVKVGRSRRYLLSDLVIFIAERRTCIHKYPMSAIATAVCAQVELLGKTATESAS